MIVLKSGAKLGITLSPFAVSKALYQAILEEIKIFKLDPKTEIDVNFWKDLFCAGFSSKKIEACLVACMERATYNGAKIKEDTFEPLEARSDYLEVCWEVTKANVLPFLKNLSAEFGPILESLKVSQK